MTAISFYSALLHFTPVYHMMQPPIRRRLHELFHPGMTCILSRDDFLLGVWSFTFECLHDLEQKCVRPGMISSRC